MLANNAFSYTPIMSFSKYLGLTLSLLYTLLLLPSDVQAQFNSSGCDCGFRDADDPTGALWTTYWENDFTQMSQKDLTTSFYYNQESIQHGTGAVRAFQAGNVAIDSAGLHLTVQPGNNGQVPSAGIFSKRLALFSCLQYFV